MHVEKDLKKKKILLIIKMGEALLCFAVVCASDTGNLVWTGEWTKYQHNRETDVLQSVRKLDSEKMRYFSNYEV